MWVIEIFRCFQSFVSEHDAFHDVLLKCVIFECKDDISECDLIYISEDCSIEISKITKETWNESILIIFAKCRHGKSGAIINFIDSEDKLKFELNQKEALRRGFKITDDLKSQAILI